MLALQALVNPHRLSTRLQVIFPEWRILVAVYMFCMFPDLMCRLFIQPFFPTPYPGEQFSVFYIVARFRDVVRVLLRPNQPNPATNTGGCPFINKVPHELYLEIMQYLSIDDLHAMTQTSRLLLQHVMPSYFQRTSLNVPVLRKTQLKLVNSHMLRAALVWACSPVFCRTPELASSITCVNIAQLSWFLWSFPPVFCNISVQVDGSMPLRQSKLRGFLHTVQRTGCKELTYTHWVTEHESPLIRIKRLVFDHLHNLTFTPTPGKFRKCSFQTLRIHSDIFDTVTQDFILDMARSARHLHLVTESDAIENHESWSALLGAIAAPHLTLVELGGSIPIHLIIQFLGRHRELDSIYIAYPSSSCLSQPLMPAISRSTFDRISAPISCTIDIFSSTEQPSVVNQLHVFPSAEFASDNEDFFSSFVKCLTKCTARRLYVEVDEPARFHPGSSNEVWSLDGVPAFPEVQTITFYLSGVAPGKHKDMQVSGRLTCTCQGNELILAGFLASYCALLSSYQKTDD